MGARTSRRRGPAAGRGLRVGFALLALILARIVPAFTAGVLAAPCEAGSRGTLCTSQDLSALQDPVGAVQAALARVSEATGVEGHGTDGDAPRREALEGLAQLTDELEALLAAATPDGERPLFLALFRAFTALGELQPDRPAAERLAWIERGREYAQLLGSPNAVARTHLVAADVWSVEGDNRRARGELLRVVDGLPDARSIHPFALAQLAETERQLGEVRAALERLERAREAIPEGDARFDSLVLRLEGIAAQVFLDLGLTDQAAPHVARELEAAARLEPGHPLATDRRLAAHIHGANLSLLREDFEGVLELVDVALAEPTRSSRGREWRGSLLSIRGAAEVALVRAGSLEVERAAATLEEALAVEGLAERERLFGVLRLAELALLAGRFDAAARHLERARTLLGPGAVRADEASAQPGPSSAIDAIDVATLATRLALESGADRAQLAARDVEISEALDAFFESWKRTPIRGGGIAFLRPRKRRALFSERMRLNLVLHGEERGARRSLEELLVAQSLGSSERRAGLPAGSLARVRTELLAPGCGLLVFVPGPDQSHAFALDADSLALFELAGTDRIGPLRRRWLRTIAEGAGSREELRLASEVCAELLPAPLRAKIAAWRGLTVVGEDLFGPLPFGELRTPEGERLALRALDFLPSLPLGLGLAARRQGDPDGERPEALTAVRLLAPTPSATVRERWRRVGNFEWNPAALAQLDPPTGPKAATGRLRVLRGGEATPDALFAATGPDVDLLEVVAHGVQDYARERPSLLVLAPNDDGTADDGLVSAERILSGYAGSRPPRLVILAACRTASGPSRPGDGIDAHLGGAFLSAGARAVVQSDGDLPFAATGDLLARIERHLERPGTSPAEALAAALRETQGSPDAARLRRLQVIGLGQFP